VGLGPFGEGQKIELRGLSAVDQAGFLSLLKQRQQAWRARKILGLHIAQTGFEPLRDSHFCFSAVAVNTSLARRKLP
jgi:hypothetical protein